MGRYLIVLPAVVLLLGLLYSSFSVSADIVTQPPAGFINVTNVSTQGFRFTNVSNVTRVNADFAWNGTVTPTGSPDSLSNSETARRLHGLNPSGIASTRFMMLGPNFNLENAPTQLPLYSSMPFRTVPIYAAGDCPTFSFFFSHF